MSGAEVRGSHPHGQRWNAQRGRVLRWSVVHITCS